MIEEENEALLSFDHYEASLANRETVPKRFLKRSLKLLGLQSGTTKNMILRIMIWQNRRGR